MQNTVLVYNMFLYCLSSVSLNPRKSAIYDSHFKHQEYKFVPLDRPELLIEEKPQQILITQNWLRKQPKPISPINTLVTRRYKPIVEDLTEETLALEPKIKNINHQYSEFIQKKILGSKRKMYSDMQYLRNVSMMSDDGRSRKQLRSLDYAVMRRNSTDNSNTKKSELLGKKPAVVDKQTFVPVHGRKKIRHNMHFVLLNMATKKNTTITQIPTTERRYYLHFNVKPAKWSNLTKHDIKPIKLVRKHPKHTEITQTEISQTEITQTEIAQTEITHTEITQTENNQSNTPITTKPMQYIQELPAKSEFLLGNTLSFAQLITTTLKYNNTKDKPNVVTAKTSRIKKGRKRKHKVDVTTEIVKTESKQSNTTKPMQYFQEIPAKSDFFLGKALSFAQLITTTTEKPKGVNSRIKKGRKRKYKEYFKKANVTTEKSTLKPTLSTPIVTRTTRMTNIVDTADTTIMSRYTPGWLVKRTSTMRQILVLKKKPKEEENTSTTISKVHKNPFVVERGRNMHVVFMNAHNKSNKTNVLFNAKEPDSNIHHIKVISVTTVKPESERRNDTHILLNNKPIDSNIHQTIAIPETTIKPKYKRPKAENNFKYVKNPSNFVYEYFHKIVDTTENSISSPTISAPHVTRTTTAIKYVKGNTKTINNQSEKDILHYVNTNIQYVQNLTNYTSLSEFFEKIGITPLQYLVKPARTRPPLTRTTKTETSTSPIETEATTKMVTEPEFKRINIIWKTTSNETNREELSTTPKIPKKLTLISHPSENTTSTTVSWVDIVRKTTKSPDLSEFLHLKEEPPRRTTKKEVLRATTEKPIEMAIGLIENTTKLLVPQTSVVQGTITTQVSIHHQEPTSETTTKMMESRRMLDLYSDYEEYIRKGLPLVVKPENNRTFWEGVPEWWWENYFEERDKYPERYDFTTAAPVCPLCNVVGEIFAIPPNPSKNEPVGDRYV